MVAEHSDYGAAGQLDSDERPRTGPTETKTETKFEDVVDLPIVIDAADVSTTLTRPTAPELLGYA